MVNVRNGARRFPGTWRVCISTRTCDASEEIMANSVPGGAGDYNTTIIEEFRANRGHVGGPWAGTTMILIHHVGARSGIERVSPLACSPQGDGRFAIVASNGGSPAHPDWYHNLKANPRITVEVGTHTFTVLAQELDDTARAELWPKLVAKYPTLGEHQAKTTRQFPVFLLTRQD
jgi:deazaflavin-dependent oxidoreductase (nitroreductase family)